jgi:divalent metal cation (Fe/Co/Zn/Cd) transporter
VDEKAAQPRANERVTNTFKEKIKSTVKGYNEVSEKSEAVKLSQAKAEYAMLPVWMMTTRYNGESYTFGINGQTGKMVGSLPIDKGLCNKYFALATIISFLVLQIVCYFLGFSLIVELIALAVSFFIGYLYLSHLKDTMNTIAERTNAMEYCVEGSFKTNRTEDKFLYTKTDKREKPKSNS